MKLLFLLEMLKTVGGGSTAASVVSSVPFVGIVTVAITIAPIVVAEWMV